MASSITIDYRRPLRLGETMRNCLRVERKGVRFVFHQDIYTPGGDLATSAQVTVVAIEDGRLSRGDKLEELLLK